MLESAALFGPGIVVPMPHAPRLALPLDTVKISAGFPSPAADYEDKRLDINDYLVRNPVSTFFFPVEGDSMQGPRYSMATSWSWIKASGHGTAWSWWPSSMASDW